MTAAAEFLTTLWGPSPCGWIQLWDLGGKLSSYYPSPGVPGVHGVDGMPDVFTAVGLTPDRLSMRTRATAAQISAIAGLWLDLDVKPGACPDRAAAIELACVHATPTLLVDSGHGVHAWHLFDGGPWRFRTVAERTAAASLARRWVAIHCQAAGLRGWRVDSVGDLARLMRLPGTLNAKDTRSAPLHVHTFGEAGPRHTRAALTMLAGAAITADVPRAADVPAIAIDMTTIAPTTAHVIRVLCVADDNFAQTWAHERDDMPTASTSEYDLSLASQMAHYSTYTNDEIAGLIVAHRAVYDPDGHKARRPKYLQDTIALARASVRR